MVKEILQKTGVGRLPPSQVVMLKKQVVPKAFIENISTKTVLQDVVNDFSFEEKQVIYYYFAMETPTASEVTRVTELSTNHVDSVLNLYIERLNSKIDFFKKIIDYNADELVPVSELLFLEPMPQLVEQYVGKNEIEVHQSVT